MRSHVGLLEVTRMSIARTMYGALGVRTESGVVQDCCFPFPLKIPYTAAEYCHIPLLAKLYNESQRCMSLGVLVKHASWAVSRCLHFAGLISSFRSAPLTSYHKTHFQQPLPLHRHSNRFDDTYHLSGTPTETTSSQP